MPGAAVARYASQLLLGSVFEENPNILQSMPASSILVGSASNHAWMTAGSSAAFLSYSSFSTKRIYSLGRAWICAAAYLRYTCQSPLIYWFSTPTLVTLAP